MAPSSPGVACPLTTASLPTSSSQPVALPPDLRCRGKSGTLLDDEGPRGVGSTVRVLIQPSTSASASPSSLKALSETSSVYPATSQTPAFLWL
ncbi:hypothetical protein V6N13_008743 [Hibiscus sabdariffa]|uniref:Uncharacterized protein n=1 Tax=Hibiscus sabdariffa TaxID=183260 RepID=A0ABR2ECT3_9ROSI